MIKGGKGWMSIAEALIEISSKCQGNQTAWPLKAA